MQLERLVAGKTGFLAELDRILRTIRRVPRLVVVERVPVPEEVVVRRDRRFVRQLHVHHHTTWREQTIAFFEDLLRGLHRDFVEEEARDDQIEVTIGEIRRLCVLLTEVHGNPLVFGERVTIAKHRRTDIDAVGLGIRIGGAVRQQVLARRRTEIKDALGFEIRKLLLEPVRDRLTNGTRLFAIRVLSREHLATERHDRALRDIVSGVFRMHPARRQMHIERGDVARNLEVRIQS